LTPSDRPDSVTTCQGCGGRNPSSSTECDWCGRPFISKTGRLRLTAWQIVSSLFLLALIGAVAALAYLNYDRPLPPVRAAAPTTTPLPTPQPTPAVTPRVTTPSPPTATPVPATAGAPTPAQEVATPEPTSTPMPQIARIANTSGQGVSVRLEPGPQAARAGVLREGTTVLLTGNDQTVAARPWREIETEDHRVKGWVSADFLQSVQTAP
jgi:hypothetical protein